MYTEKIQSLEIKKVVSCIVSSFDQTTPMNLKIYLMAMTSQIKKKLKYLWSQKKEYNTS